MAVDVVTPVDDGWSYDCPSERGSASRGECGADSNREDNRPKMMTVDELVEAATDVMVRVSEAGAGRGGNERGGLAVNRSGVQTRSG